MNSKGIELKRFVQIGAWMFLALAAIDVALNLTFPHPEAPPRKNELGALNSYFEYGRSTEGKVRRVLGRNNETAWPIALAGHIGTPQENLPDRREESSDLFVSVYGMSHANLLASAVTRTDPSVSVRSVAAPGATANWAFAAFEHDLLSIRPDAVVLGLLTNNIPMLRSASPMTWSFDSPTPYMQPIFKMDRGNLLRIWRDELSTADGVRHTFNEPEAFEKFKNFLQKNDIYYNPIIFSQSVFDHSALIRLARRSYATSFYRELSADTSGPNGFNLDSDAIILLNVLVTEFANKARQAQSIPVVYIANNYGPAPFLYEALEKTLQEANILNLSSHEIAQTSDPNNYLPDTHFVKSVDDKLAVKLIKKIRTALNEKKAKVPNEALTRE